MTSIEPSEKFVDPGERIQSERSKDGDTWLAWFMPDPKIVEKLSEHEKGRLPARGKLMSVSRVSGIIEVFPLITYLSRSGYMVPRNSRIRSFELSHHYQDKNTFDQIELEDWIACLPRGFVKRPDWGLGLRRRYRVIEQVIEKHTSCSVIRIADNEPSEINGETFIYEQGEFDKLVTRFDQVADRAASASHRVREIDAFNGMAERLGQKKLSYRRSRIEEIQMLVNEAADLPLPLTEDEQISVVDIVAASADEIEADNPLRIQQLRHILELVALKDLVTKFAENLLAGHGEDYWQKFFEVNPFILQQLFGFPVVFIASNVPVGGIGFDGTGEKKADFLYKNAITNDACIIEIKKPGSSILSNRPYRGNVYGPSKELAGGISQLLDQRYQLQRQLDHAVRNSGETVDSYYISACLIIGMTPTNEEGCSATDSLKKSFDLIRHNSRNVQVLTFDEVLGRLRQLAELLEGDHPAMGRTT